MLSLFCNVHHSTNLTALKILTSSDTKSIDMNLYSQVVDDVEMNRDLIASMYVFVYFFRKAKTIQNL
jgi:hypothetical protein